MAIEEPLLGCSMGKPGPMVLESEFLRMIDPRSLFYVQSKSGSVLGHPLQRRHGHAALDRVEIMSHALRARKQAHGAGRGMARQTIRRMFFVPLRTGFPFQRRASWAMNIAPGGWYVGATLAA